MRSLFICIIFSAALNFSFGQSIQDSAGSETRPGKILVFSRAEIMPEFKFGLRALEDSVKQYLLKTDFKFPGTNIHVVLTVSKSGDITGVQILNDSETLQAGLLKKSLVATSGSWIPAKQNEHIVSCYKKLSLNFSGTNLKISNDN
ncbi:MAG: hypothetical protein ABI594_15350 [Ginsengibacter sp.]